MTKAHVFRSPPIIQRVNLLWRTRGGFDGAARRFPAGHLSSRRPHAWLHREPSASLERRITRLTRHRYVSGQVQAAGRSEAAAALDTSAAVAARSVAIAETSTATDVRSGQATFATLLDDVAAAGEVTAAAANLVVGAGELGSAVEVVQTALTIPGPVNELALAGDVPSATLAASAEVAEAGSAGQEGASSVSLSLSSGDSASAVEASDRSSSVNTACSELVAADDIASAVSIVSGLAGENAAPSDVAWASSTVSCVATESAAVADVPGGAADLIGGAAESVAWLDLAEATNHGQAACDETAAGTESIDAGRLFAESAVAAEAADAAETIAGSLVYFGDDPQERSSAEENSDADWIAGGVVAESEVTTAAASAVVFGPVQVAESGAASDDGGAFALLIDSVVDAGSATGIAVATLVRGSTIVEWAEAGQSATGGMAGSSSVDEQHMLADTLAGSVILPALCAEDSTAADSAMGVPQYSAGTEETTPAADVELALAALAAAALEMVSAAAVAGTSAIGVAASAESTPIGEAPVGSVLASVSSGEGAGAVDHIDRGSSIGDRVDELALFVEAILATAATTIDEMVQPLDASRAEVPFDPAVHAHNTATVTFERRRARVQYSSPHARR